ncbi:MAG: hypothetical protein LC135_12985 [Phycisphaerae bacterium]|jgi:hypothetical protein|nr:hypothetical protein [Phycisphaerae bacterium]MCZ2400767.1 hypothetical protein [Phycisphaerae bacterium]
MTALFCNRAGALGAAIIALSAAASAQVTVGPQVRIDVAGGTAAANETTMASTDFNPLRVVGAWNDWRPSVPPNEIIRMGVAISFNGGATWTDSVLRPPLANQSSVEGDPMTCYDNRTGTLWVGAISFASNGGVYVARMGPTDLGFGPSVMAATTGGADKGWMAAGPRPGLPDTTRVYIAYNQGLLRSDTMGSSWTGPVGYGGGLGFLPRVGPGGQLYICYWDIGTGVRLKRSLNGGDSFTDLPIATRMDVWGVQDGSRFPGTFRVPAMNYLAVDPVDGTLYCVYFDTTNIVNGQRNVDLYFTRSTNQGTSWTTPKVINGDSSPPGDQFWPWIEVDQQQNLHMVFMDSRGFNQNDGIVNGMFNMYYAFSSDKGDTWQEHKLTPAAFNSDNDGLNRPTQFMGDYLGLAVGGNRVYPCYLSSQNGDTDIFTNVVIVTPPCPADLNGDGVIGQADLGQLLSSFGKCSGDIGFDPAADLDGDGCVGQADLGVLLGVFGQSCP